MNTDGISAGLRARAALEAQGFHTSHPLGQNFLLDDRLLTGLLDRVQVQRGDSVLEIGPGPGVMTALLAERAGRVAAFEVDEALRPVLDSVLAGADNVQVIFADFLRQDVDAIPEIYFSGNGYRVVANLPYYITADAILRLVTASVRPLDINVMVQKEAAERLMSRPGQKNWCALAAFVRWYGAAECLEEVPRSAFSPPPHVDSRFIAIRRREHPGVSAAEEEMLFRVIRAAFAMRRKKLTNNLKAAFGMTQEAALRALSDAGIDENARGEALDLETLLRLARALRS